MSIYQGVAHNSRWVPKFRRAVDGEIELYRNWPSDEIGLAKNTENTSFWAQTGSPWIDMGPYLVTIFPIAYTELFKLVLMYFRSIPGPEISKTLIFRIYYFSGGGAIPWRFFRWGSYSYLARSGALSFICGTEVYLQMAC